MSTVRPVIRVFGGVNVAQPSPFFGINGEFFLARSGETIPTGSATSQVTPDKWELNPTPPSSGTNANLYYATGQTENQFTYDRQGGTAQNLQLDDDNLLSLTAGTTYLFRHYAQSNTGGGTQTSISLTASQVGGSGFVYEHLTDGYFIPNTLHNMLAFVCEESGDYRLGWRPAVNVTQTVNTYWVRFQQHTDLLGAQGFARYKPDWSGLSTTPSNGNVPTGWSVSGATGQVSRDPGNGDTLRWQGNGSVDYLKTTWPCTSGKLYDIYVNYGSQGSNALMEVYDTSGLLTQINGAASTGSYHLQATAVNTGTMELRLSSTNTSGVMLFEQFAVVEADGNAAWDDNTI